MTSPDDEFDDFLRKRRPLFGRDDDLEPPLELDRVVLRQAREAIESERSQRVFRAPSWGMPVALAATLVLAFTIILRVGTPDVVRQPDATVQNVSRQVEIPAAASTPPPAAMDSAAAPAEAPLAAQASDSGPMVVDIGAGSARAESDATADAIMSPAAEQRARRLEKVADTAQPARSFVSEEEAARYSQPMGASSRAAGDQQASTGVIINGQRMDASSTGDLRTETATAPAAPKPDYRRDSKTWLAEIDRLRAAGEIARADAELAEYKREHRAYAVAPDR